MDRTKAAGGLSLRSIVAEPCNTRSLGAEGSGCPLIISRLAVEDYLPEMQTVAALKKRPMRLRWAHVERRLVKRLAGAGMRLDRFP
jgi:hypothetical protein